MNQHNSIPAFYLNVQLAGLMAIYYFVFVKKVAQSTPGVDWYFLLFSCHLLVSPFVFYPLLASPENSDLFYELLLAASLLYMASLAHPVWRTGAIETLLARLAFTYLSATVFSIPFFGFYIWLPDFWPARAAPLFMAVYSAAATLKVEPAVPKTVFLDFSIRTPADHQNRVRTIQRGPLVQALYDPTIHSVIVYQITDVHLGYFMSIDRLHWICTQAISSSADLIFLTGDFLSLETTISSGIDQESTKRLVTALSPLQAARGRVFWCFGNHDHDTPDCCLMLKAVMTSLGIHAVGDSIETIFLGQERPAVRLICANYYPPGEERELKMRALIRKSQSFSAGEERTLKIMLAHDPSVIDCIQPDDGVDLMLSGHMHGGVWGVQALGLPWTVGGLVMRRPDHGLWQKGNTFAYVHRGQGSAAFPLRFGVTAENGPLVIFYKK